MMLKPYEGWHRMVIIDIENSPQFTTITKIPSALKAILTKEEGEQLCLHFSRVYISSIPCLVLVFKSIGCNFMNKIVETAIDNLITARPRYEPGRSNWTQKYAKRYTSHWSTSW